MNLDERARKIVDALEGYFDPICGPEDMDEFTKKIAAELRAVQEEAELKAQGPASSKLLNAMVYETGLKDGLEKAAEIAESHQERRNSHRFLAIHIAKRIRKLALESKL